MIYPHLPPVGSLAAPNLTWRESPNRSARLVRSPRLIFVHRWGGGTFGGVCGWLSNPVAKASAHGVYAGEVGPDAGKAAQLVPWQAKAWTECALNDVGISIETADAIWTGHDPEGFARLARTVALLCRLHLDACRPVRGAGILAGSHGFTRHADAGALGCGHYECPTTDAALWSQFSARTVAEYRHGGFRAKYGR